MGIPVFILGQSGTGKSTSLRNFKSNEIALINVMSKPLPFKGAFTETYNGDDYAEIAKSINKSKKKTIVIDDAQYLMANEFMRRALEKGYDKFTEIANNFWTLINGITNGLDNDVIVYFLMHTDTSDDGCEKAKTIGKMLDEKICIEGMVSIVLKTAVKDGVYKFVTQNNGRDTVKSPLGMFTTFEIDNDLKIVDQTIREYWNLGGDASEIMEQHDAEVDAGGVSTEAPKAEKTSRRSRRAAELEQEETPKRRERKKRDTEQPSEAAEAPTAASNDDAGETIKPRERRRRNAAESASEENPRRNRRSRRAAELEQEDITDDEVPF